MFFKSFYSICAINMIKFNIFEFEFKNYQNYNNKNVTYLSSFCNFNIYFNQLFQLIYLKPFLIFNFNIFTTL